MDEYSPFGPIFQTATLGAGGTGTVSFQATDKPLRITNISVRVSTNVVEATAEVYKSQVGALYRLSGTFAGSSGDNNSDPIDLYPGERVYVVWTGGDVGAIATATFSGLQIVPGGGFRALG